MSYKSAIPRTFVPAIRLRGNTGATRRPVSPPTAAAAFSGSLAPHSGKSRQIQPKPASETAGFGAEKRTAKWPFDFDHG
jgi:hypothetical protein